MYTCIKIYNRTEQVVSQFDLEDKVDEWIKFNSRYFPHCPLFVNGECKSMGHLSKETILELQGQL